MTTEARQIYYICTITTSFLYKFLSRLNCISPGHLGKNKWYFTRPRQVPRKLSDCCYPVRDNIHVALPTFSVHLVVMTIVAFLSNTPTESKGSEASVHNVGRNIA